MIFSKVNLRRELIRERIHQQHLLQKANELLNSSAEKDKEVIARLKNSAFSETSFIDVDVSDDNIFSLEEIKLICIRYRLRFLDSSHFRSEYPYTAVAEINAFEKKYGKKIESFRIIAPSQAFDLENINKDPLLFAQLNHNSFYLIHQWGHELAWYRRILSWPLQSFKTLFISLWFVCAAFAFLIPSSVMNIFNFESEIYLRLWLTVHTFIGTLGLCLWAGLAFDKSFSSMSWDSKYFNY